MRSYESQALVGAAREGVDGPERRLGLFRGVRTYTLHPQSDQSTLFTMREEFTVRSSEMMWRSMPDLQPSFDQFARGLKERAEAN